MSTDAIRVYERIARQETVAAADTHHLEELVAWGLVGYDATRPDLPVALDPKKAMQRRLADEIDEARVRVARIAALPALSEELSVHFERAQWRSAGGSEFLEDQATVNARLDNLIAGARMEILAAQPGGPRTRMLLERSVARDQEALTRGVEMRTLYRDTVRSARVTGEYAGIMTGLGVKYRTLVGPFERCIIVDRRIAFISDYVVDGAPDHAAWCVTDRAMVAYIAAEFEGKWRRAEPWRGELRPRGCQGVDAVSGASPGGARTTRRQREITRCLLSGKTTAVVAATIGISKRKLDEEIAELKGVAGVSTLMELGFWWATCPDRLVDDTVPAGPGEDAKAGTGESDPAGAAVA